MSIEVKKSGLSAIQLENFLRKIDGEFVRPLSTRVGNLAAYAKKLFDNAEIIIAVCDDNLAGIAVTYMNDKSTCCAFLTQLVVLKKFRGQNIGQQLLDFTIELAKKSGMEKMRLEVDTSAIPARELYKKSGFVEESESTESIIMVKYFNSSY